MWQVNGPTSQNVGMGTPQPPFQKNKPVLSILVNDSIHSIYASQYFILRSWKQTGNTFCQCFLSLDNLKGGRQYKNKYIYKNKPQILYITEFFQSNVNLILVVVTTSQRLSSNLAWHLACVSSCTWSYSKLES